ncbi:MAG: OmpA family protein [Alphaproteobacteria bacterium]|nr:OmpA family protein [Alphaproteobacteria bacterium]
MIIAKFSKFFSRSLHAAPLRAPSLCGPSLCRATYGTMLSIVALTTAAFGMSLYGASLSIGPAHAASQTAPQEAQEPLQELKNYTPPPMFTSDDAPNPDQDDEGPRESATAPATASNLGMPATSPPTIAEQPRVKIISTSNKTYDAIPRATITTIPAPIANSGTATPTIPPTPPISAAIPTTTAPMGEKISSPKLAAESTEKSTQSSAPKSPETPAIKPSEKIYDAPPKEWINTEEDRTAGMAQHPPLNQSKNDDPQINPTSPKTPTAPVVEPIVESASESTIKSPESLPSSKNLPNLSPEDLLSHPAENNHVLTLRADPQDSLPIPTQLPTPLPTPVKASMQAPVPSAQPAPSKNLSASSTPPSVTKAVTPKPLTETAPPVPDHKPASLPKTLPAKPTAPKPAAVKPAISKISPPKTDSKAIDSKAIDSKNTNSKTAAPITPPATPPAAQPAAQPAAPAATPPIVTAPQPPSQAPIQTTNISSLDQFSLEFSPGATDLTADQRELLLQNVIKTLTQDSALRVQILSYASRMDGAESSARRVSLSRALAVRSYLLENKIAPSRIDVRALSDNTTETPADRMDLEFTK